MERYELKLLREKDIRRINSHIRLEAIVLLTNRVYNFIDTFKTKVKIIKIKKMKRI